jgi:hypothetical protein
MFMSSREQLRVKEAERERKRATVQGPEVLKSQDSGRKYPPHLVVSEDTIREEPVSAEMSHASEVPPGRGTSPLRNSFTVFTRNDGDDPTGKGLIPQRGSSLRHSGSPSRKSRKSHGRKNSRRDSYKTNTVPEEDESAEPVMSAKDKILKELEAEEDEVARRIRELRKQKLLREKIAGKLPANVDAGAASSGANVSPITSPEPSPTSSLSSTSERRVQDPRKAHKVLGITMPPAQEPQPCQGPEPEPTVEPTVASETIETHTRPRHTRNRSLTVNDGDDLTPLPINYRLALQALERPSSPPPPSSSAASSKGTVSSTPPTHSKSVAVGGRSAVGRRTTSSIIMGGTTTHKRSPSVTGGPPRENSFRSNSEEIASRQHSLNMTAPPPSSTSPQRRPTLKKKRWSHPDLPARAEKAHNAKIDATNTAVQPPPHPVIEERPTSVDSIDMDVEAYLNSPRLSQKVRHPQTGRIISFSDVGDPNGFAIFVCVGMGLTRYVMAFYDQLATTLKLRLITPDRPGIGGSQPDPNGTPLSWPGKPLELRCKC